MKKIIYTIILFIFGINVYALTVTPVCPSSVGVGNEYDVYIKVDGLTEEIHGVGGTLSYNSSQTSYNKATGYKVQVPGWSAANDDDTFKYYDKTYNYAVTSSTNIVKYTFTAHTVGTTTISVLNPYSIGLTDSDITNAINSSCTIRVLSNDASLRSLNVTGCTLEPTFSSNSFDYVCYTDNDTVTINAESAEVEAIVDGSGIKRDLNYGSNKFVVKVTSPSKLKKNEYNINVIRNDGRSKNSSLRSLSVDNGTLSPGFNSTKYSYTVNVGSSVSSINIRAIANDTKATVVGSGTKQLNYGSNTFKVECIAENGTSTTYTIVVIREDSRSDDNTLKSLEVKNNGNNLIKYNGASTYVVNVGNDVTSVNIIAYANDNKATVSGSTGTVNLKIGVNKFYVNVTAENGSVKSYVVTIVREDPNGNSSKLNSNNNLSSLSITGYELDFNSEVLEYTINIESSNPLEINAINDSNATIEIVGNENFVIGTNVIKINVYAENGELKTYVINAVWEEIEEKAKLIAGPIDEKDNNALILGICVIIIFAVTFGIVLLSKKKKRVVSVTAPVNNSYNFEDRYMSRGPNLLDPNKYIKEEKVKEATPKPLDNSPAAQVKPVAKMEVNNDIDLPDLVEPGNVVKKDRVRKKKNKKSSKKEDLDLPKLK